MRRFLPNLTRFIHGRSILSETLRNDHFPDTTITYAKMSFANDILQGDIADGAIGQGELTTTNGAVSDNGAGAHYTLPGGNFGFWPNSDTAAGGPMDAQVALGFTGSSFVNSIYLDGNSSDTVYARQYYVQACPPYDLGDGEIRYFVFIAVERGSNPARILGMYLAPEAPWHYNGPTNIAAKRYDAQGRGFRKERGGIVELLNGEYTLEQLETDRRLLSRFRQANETVVDLEITQAIKNRDIDLIPTPFHQFNVDYDVIMLDPMSGVMEDINQLSSAGSNIGKLIHRGDIRFTNTQVSRITPANVRAYDVRWR